MSEGSFRDDGVVVGGRERLRSEVREDRKHEQETNSQKSHLRSVKSC